MQTATLIAAGIAITGALVRTLKSDTLDTVLAAYGLPSVPKRVLPWVALVLGIMLACLTELATQGVSHWQDALVQGLLEGLGIGPGAIAVNELGKGVPGVRSILGTPSERASGPSLLVLAAVAAFGLSSCTPQEAKTAATVALDAGQIACAILHAESSDATVAEVCGIADVLLPDLRTILAAHRQKARAMACGAPDAGADGGGSK